MRKLVTIRRIDDIQPIKKADMIEVATIGGWKAVVGKGQFEIGETIIYCEIDSFLPIREEFEFLRKTSYLQMEDGSEGFRLRTLKLRGQISQGLVLKLDILNNTIVDNERLVLGFQSRIGGAMCYPHSDDTRTYTLGNGKTIIELNRGTDVTEILGVTKYEKPIPKELEGMVISYIEGRIHKTDEERIQNLTQDYEEMKQYSYYESEKMDGESFTSFLLDDRFGVCTRELDLIVPDEYSDDLPRHLRFALKHKLEEKVRSFGTNIAFQGELIGPGIKKNKYNLEKLEVRLFNVFDIDTYTYFNKEELEEFAKRIGVEVCPVVNKSFKLPDTIDELLSHVDGKSILNKNTSREGSVFVSIDSPERISFKVISNNFLLKGGE